MSELHDVVPDPTDSGTLRPDLPPTSKLGTKFEPMECPEFDFKINLPPHIKPRDAFGIFTLFFSHDQLQIIVENTNKNQLSSAERGQLDVRTRNGPQDRRARGGQYARKWTDTTVDELYKYLGIRIYMGLHPENEIRYYWNRCQDRPVHYPVIRAMSL